MQHAQAIPATRATIYFNGNAHGALRMKAVASGLSISDLANRSLYASLKEDADGVQAHLERSAEFSLDFADVALGLKFSGKI